MSELRIKNQLPLGIAWLWVKASFATFREKPIHFLAFAITYILFSLFPFFGGFLSVFILVRIYLSSDKIAKDENFDVALNLGELLRQRNILSYALFSMGFDLIGMSVISETLNSWGLSSATQMNAAAMSDPRFLYLLVGVSIFRHLFFGISLVIVSFNPEIKVLQSLLLSWKFILKHLVLLVFALFLLLPFLLLPLYLSVLLAVSINNVVVLAIAAFLLLIVILLFISVTAIFSYKLYQDGMEYHD